MPELVRMDNAVSEYQYRLVSLTSEVGKLLESFFEIRYLERKWAKWAKWAMWEKKG